MPNASLSDADLDRLRAVLLAGPRLRLAMLFGTAAGGCLRADSDIDIAILPDEDDLTLHDELALQVALAGACGREVDLVRLDRASTLVRWEVARRGRPLYTSEPAGAARFCAQAASEWIDFAPAFQRAGKTFLRRMAAERPR